MAAMSPSLSLISAALAGLVTGYMFWDVFAVPFGASSRRNTRCVNKTRPEDSDRDSDHASDSDSDLDSDEVAIDSSLLNNIPGEVRMSLVVRQDLKMGKGKAAAQCSHATLALYKKMSDPQLQAYNPHMLRRWEYGNGQAKITLQVPTQEDMDLLFATAMSLGVNAYIVHDAGRTQIAAGSATVLGLGPAPKSVMDQITGGLKLY